MQHLTLLCSLGFSTIGVEFTAYTSFSVKDKPHTDMPAVPCNTDSAKISLATHYFISTPTGDIRWFYEVVQTSSAYSIDPVCSVSVYTPLYTSMPKDFPWTAPLSTTLKALSTSSLEIPLFPPLSTFPTTPVNKTTTTKNQNQSAGLTETKKLIIGLVVAIAVTVTIGLSSLCIIRRHRRRRAQAAASDKDGRNQEGEDGQLYFQQKVELDDEQRRHEMDAAELRYEMEGQDVIHELPGNQELKQNHTQELCGEEHAKQLDDVHACFSPEVCTL